MNLKQFLVFVTFVFLTVFAYSQQLQQLTGSAGGNNTDLATGSARQGYIIDWVVGEPFSETLVASKKILTQGILQGKYVQNDTLSLDPILSDDFLSVEIYPNPVTTNLFLDFNSNSNIGHFLVEIIDLQGRKLFSLPVFKSEGSVKIGMDSYKEGVYVLRLSSITYQKFKTYPIVKI